MQMRTSQLLLGAFLAASAVAQMPVPPFGSTFTSTLTRGFWFQAPVSFTVTGLSVPNEAAQPFQVVEFIDLGTNPPPAYASTVVGTQMFYDNSTAGGSIIPTAISCVAGNYYGILGACTNSVGSSTSYNSYALTSGPFTSDILGNPTTITRFGTQFGIGAGGNNPCWSEAAGSIARVDVYVSPSGSGTLATKTNYGIGCPAPSAPAIYELFQPATIDLSNMSLMFIPTGGGSYTIIPGPNQWYSGFTNNLALGDDACATLTTPFPFTHAGGTTSTISVSSNGFVWLGSNTNSACCSGDNVSFLNDPMARIAPCWMDLYPPGAVAGGGVFADLDPVSGDYVITWNQVPEYSSNPPVTMQLALQASGVFEIRYQTVGNVSHQALAGYSVGSVTMDPGSSNLSSVTTAPLSMGAYATPMTLSASARPVLGTSTNLNTGAIVAGSLAGVNSLGFGQHNPGIDLTPFGAPACSLYLNPGYNALFLVGGATNSMPIGIPSNPALSGLHVFAQSLVIAPSANLLGLITSNGVDLRLGNL